MAAIVRVRQDQTAQSGARPLHSTSCAFGVSYFLLLYTSSAHRTAKQCGILKHTATHRGIPQHTARRCKIHTSHAHLVEIDSFRRTFGIFRSRIHVWLPCTATHCNELQRTAKRCNTLEQHTAHCKMMQHICFPPAHLVWVARARICDGHDSACICVARLIHTCDMTRSYG